MYNWNLPLLVLLCVLNTIEADVSLVDGREHSHERPLRSFYPSIRSFANRNIRLRKGSPETPVRKEYRDIPILQENRRESRTRTDQSRNANRGLSRFPTNYDRLSFRQRQAEKNHYFRLVGNRVFSLERLEALNQRRTLRNLNNLRTGSDIRQMHDTTERMPSLNRFNGIKWQNTQEVHRESSNSKNRIIRSSEVLRRVSTINREIENTNSSSRNPVNNMRKINGPLDKPRLNRGDRYTINEDTRSDEQRERKAPSVESRQMARIISSRQDIRNYRSISRDNQRIIRSNTENIVVRREPEIRNEQSNIYELRLNKRSLSSRSSQLSFGYNGASRAMFAMERDKLVRRDINLKHTERNIRENGNQRSSDVVRGVLRSLKRMNVRDNTETTVRMEKVERAVRDARTRQVRKLSIKTNVDDSFSSTSNERVSINKNVVRREARKIQPDERDAHLKNNQRSSLGETERNSFRHTRESDRIRNNMDRNVRINERNTELRLRIHSRSAERFKESTETQRGNTERNSRRSNEDKTSERRQQRTGYTHSVRRTRFDERQMRSSNSRGNSDQDIRMRQNVNRNVDRRTCDNSANGRMSQVGIRRDVRESGLIQQFEMVEKNRRIREYGLSFDHWRNILTNMGNERNSFNWQAAFYALQAIYICSIVFKVCNKTDSTKNKLWSFSWLSVPVNKFE